LSAPGTFALKARKYLVAASTSARSRAVYAGDFAGGILTYCLFVFVFSRIWRAVYASNPSIEGYDYAMSVWYFAVAEIPGFAVIGSFWELANDIKSGQVAYQVSRPYSYVAYRFSEAAGSSLVAALPIAAAGLALGTAVAGPPPIASVAQAAALVASLLLAGSLNFLLQLAVAMTAFWFEENAAFYWIYQKLMLVAGTLLPLEFLPSWASRIVRWTPFPSLSYAPARIAVAFEPGPASRLLGAQAAWTAAAAAACLLLYSRGRSKLTSQGG
jgi:ABC-2 type transport system permease protein